MQVTNVTFVNWTESGVIVSTSASYAFTVAGDRTLVANFAAAGASYTVTASASPSTVETKVPGAATSSTSQPRRRGTTRPATAAKA